MPVLQWVTLDPASLKYSASREIINQHFQKRASARRNTRIALRASTKSLISVTTRSVNEWQTALCHSPESPLGKIVDENSHAKHVPDTTSHLTTCYQNEPNTSDDKSVILAESLTSQYVDQSEACSLFLIQYVNTTWMPNGTNIPSGCHLAGYSPIRCGDDFVGRHIVSGALQRGGFPYYSLLAICRARMEFVSSPSVVLHSATISAIHQAIRCLRQEILSNVASYGEELILGLAFVILTAVFAGYPHTTVSDYGAMMRHLVLTAGGVARLTSFTAFFVTSTDFLAASVVLTRTSLTFGNEDYIETNSSPVYMSTISYDPYDQSSPSPSDERVRVSIMSHRLISSIMGRILSLPDYVADEIRTYVRQHAKSYYHVATRALKLRRDQHADDDMMRDRLEIWHNDTQLARADLMLVRARYLALGLWLRSISNTLLQEERVGLKCILFPENSLVNDAEHMKVLLLHAQELLEGTDWEIPVGLLDWMLALHEKVLKRRKSKHCNKSCDSTSHDSSGLTFCVNDVSSKYLPLDYVNAKWHRTW